MLFIGTTGPKTITTSRSSMDRDADWRAAVYPKSWTVFPVCTR